MSIDLRLGVIAVALFTVFVILGLGVSNRPLTRLDAEAVYFRGQLTRLALLFTLSGRSPAMTASCVVAIGAYSVLRLPIGIAVLMALSQLLSQILVEYMKPLFRRMRPDYWLVGLEAGHSYPSGHSTTAVVFFIGWAIVLALGTLAPDVKTAGMALLTVWALGVMWSRLALGAHYLSDVAGGALFGAAWLCAAFTIFSHFYGILR
ncbi:MAG TPA: phosphatase PAP2 family protein [Candidatus Baltobacteraceae bacterium]|nr:phosphatase PAP2 family protein [Candidatus Baltobacteraceae bacterium]